MSIIAIIPARGGSKGIPKKNTIDFYGQPLISRSIQQAKAAQHIKEVYVSTDDKEIAEVSENYGAKIIWRPAELATDTSSSEDALLHAVDQIEKQGGIDLVVFLQATSPLRDPEDIDGAIDKLITEGADSLFSAALLDDFCLWEFKDDKLRGLTFDPHNRGRRQDRKPLFLENGSIYVFRPEILRSYNNRLGGKIAIYEMPFWKSYEIDTVDQIEVCEYYFNRNLLNRWSAQKSISIKAQDIDLVVYDFDGVMTDNRVIVSQDGTEAVTVNRADGLGVDYIRSLGIPQLILSTETNPVVKARASKLKLEVIESCNNKKEALMYYCQAKGIDLQRVIYIGNDLNDLEAMSIVGIPMAPSDGHPEIKKLAKITLRAKGGEGVIKELSDYYFGA